MACIAAPVNAQVTDAGARMHQVGDGVHVIVHADATDEWPHGNTGVVVGADGVLVVDSTYLPARAQADMALIRRLTKKPVRYLVNTHWHGDHTHGNAAYREAYPGLEIISALGNREFIGLNQLRYPRLATAAASSKRASLQALERQVTIGLDADGKTLSDAERTRVSALAAKRRDELAGLSAVRVAPPDRLFDETLALDLGGRTVELITLSGNSPHDVIVYVPQARAVFAGDLVVSPVPYAIKASPRPWIASLKRLETMPVGAVIPGHGDVLPGTIYVRQVRNLLETAQARVEEQLALGKSIDDIKRIVTLDDLRPAFVDGGGDAALQWQSSIDGLLDSTWSCSVGYSC